MKRSKVFLAVGTFLLAITALLSTKANKRFASITTGFFAARSCFITNLGSLNLTVKHTSGYYPVYVTVSTTGGQIGSGLHYQLTTSAGTGLYRLD